MQILTRTKCRACGGSGSIIPDEKLVFDKKWIGKRVPQSEIIKFKYEYGYNPTDPHMVECMRCGGERFLKKWMDADEVSAVLREII